jgi:C_GCAxxG_C_C family probable redox protein
MGFGCSKEFQLKGHLTMVNNQALKSKIQELAVQEWDLSAIESRCRAAVANGFARKTFGREEILSNKQQILDRVQTRAEEYNYFIGNCARSTALAVMEEFGLGNLEVLKALSPFPGFGGTGWMCGGITGGLIALGLFGGSEELGDHAAMGVTMAMAQQFMKRFEQEVGAFTCPQIQESVVFGHYMDPGASPENMKEFEKAKGFEKCSLLPGIGARIASEIIIENILGTE